MKILKLSLYSVFFAVLMSCNNQDPKKEQEKIVAETQNQEPVSDEAQTKLNELIGSLPIPTKGIGNINTDIAYNETILNPTSNISHYQTNFQKTLNYGVYSMDLVYSAAFNKKQKVMDYFRTTQLIAEDLGAGRINNDFSKIDFEKVSKNHDSLMDLSNKVYWAMDDYLKTNKRLEAVSLIYAGSWVESQFIILDQKNIKKGSSLAFLQKRVTEQKEQVSKLIELLTEFKENADIVSFSAQLAEYQKTYNELIKTESDITLENCKKLSEKISALRNKITA